MPFMKKTGKSIGAWGGKSSARLFATSDVRVSRRQPKKTIYIDLDDKPVRANVVRQGRRVPAVIADNIRKEELLGRLVKQPLTKSPRVLDQSIAPGTKVGSGTEVDLVLTPRENVKVGIFDDVHIAVRERSVVELLDMIKGQNQLLDLALKYDTADEVEDTDKVIMSQLMSEKAGMPIDENKDGQRFRDGFNAMRAALAFK